MKRNSLTHGKLKSVYFNKCRTFEDYVEELQNTEGPEALELARMTNRDSINGHKSTGSSSSVAKSNSEESVDTAKLDEDKTIVHVGFTKFTRSEFRDVIAQMLTQLPLADKRVPILGTYQHTCSGNTIVTWLQENLEIPNVVSAEAFGQSLLTEGYIRYLGVVGGTFCNSSNIFYQWKDKAFQFCGLKGEAELAENVKAVPIVGTYLSGYLSNRKRYASETTLQRLEREAKEANSDYKSAVRDLDKTRTLLEENLFDHFVFLQSCVKERAGMVKDVFSNTSAVVSNVVPAMQATADQIGVFHEIIQPDAEVRFILESHATGPFLPHVEVHEDYYNNVDEQTFGVELDFLARRDKKRVPLLISTILSYLDECYPAFESDDQRQMIWTRSPPLSSIHQLREAIIQSNGISREILTHYDPQVIVGLLKLFLLELPDSPIPSKFYEVVRSIYVNHGADETMRNRLVQSMLSQLRIVNIAALDAIITHLSRLNALTTNDASSEFINRVSVVFSLCFLRPETWTVATQHDKHPQKLAFDLLSNGPLIFTELKRSAASHRKASITGRSVSIDSSISADPYQRPPSIESLSLTDDATAVQETQTEDSVLKSLPENSKSPSRETSLRRSAYGYSRKGRRVSNASTTLSTTERDRNSASPEELENVALMESNDA
ncbi:rho-type GTPase activating protein Rga8 [Schizosaccharomyces japonicus yFS275]|uniref:Rho-type GTPase activating protein Rga8 n=1 Tax=Schizosaccharomyces japonicus (strain yFS275 / FY16936) TaxID=402676 RepID=B6K2U8_SCHJY|nr:rho-type GTPase activating protein Rga8 [Schizosaccharomyces japonicus yFS275]EEB08588.2 rho-type GTPase activating protein Rga8 [Schizosaccharomyces japonicus yFS275]